MRVVGTFIAYTGVSKEMMLYINMQIVTTSKVLNFAAYHDILLLYFTNPTFERT